MTLLLLFPGLLAVAIELLIRGGTDLVLMVALLNLAMGLLAAICLRWAPLWAVAATLLWAGSTLITWLLFQLAVIGLPPSTFTALSAAIGAAVLVPVVAAWLRVRSMRQAAEGSSASSDKA